tara:strand:+ start:628 stop:948 length:321 start_codon:yes stop_codon:yes gene_type:complete
MNQVEITLTERLKQEFDPRWCEVVNESHRHNVPVNSETHFKVTLVTESFANLRQVQRHQRIYKVLDDLLSGPIHALALHTFTPSEWAQRSAVPPSPNCLGGEKGNA